MTREEKEALLKRIYALPTEWADAGGSYGEGGPVGSEDAAMLWPEAVIDTINQFAEDNNAPDKQPDTITGLAPCGCGGNAVVVPKDNGFYIVCDSCEVSTTQDSFFNGTGFSAQSLDDAREDWNTAMGWREKE